MKAIEQNPNIRDWSDCIFNMLCVLDLSLILSNTFCGIYSIKKESKYTAVFLSINSETQCVTLGCLSSRFITYTPCFILGKLSLEKSPLNLGS